MRGISTGATERLSGVSRMLMSGEVEETKRFSARMEWDGGEERAVSIATGLMGVQLNRLADQPVARGSGS